MFGRRKTFGRAAPKPVMQSPMEQPQDDDPLLNAAIYVTIVSGVDRVNILVNRLREPIGCTNASSAEGACFLFDSEGGISGKFYFFPEFASVWPDGEPAPRPQIPTAMIANRVPGYLEALRHIVLAVPRPHRSF